MINVTVTGKKICGRDLPRPKQGPEPFDRVKVYPCVNHYASAREHRSWNHGPFEK